MADELEHLNSKGQLAREVRRLTAANAELKQRVEELEAKLLAADRLRRKFRDKTNADFTKRISELLQKEQQLESRLSRAQEALRAWKEYEEIRCEIYRVKSEVSPGQLGALWEGLHDKRVAATNLTYEALTEAEQGKSPDAEDAKPAECRECVSGWEPADKTASHVPEICPCCNGDWQNCEKCREDAAQKEGE